MIALLFLLLMLLQGIILSYVLFSTKVKPVIHILAGCILGPLIVCSFLYWFSFLTKSLTTSLIVYSIFFVASIIFCKKYYGQTLFLFKKIDKTSYVVLLFLFLFSYWLFSKTFGYDSVHGNMLIASNVYMDFGAHMPFIRSFSMGNNFPGEVPFFGNSGLLYYFLFDFYAGVVEHLGMRIDIAYNLTSAIAFTCLLVFMYQLALLIFKKRSIGMLSVVLFLFSSNLSFITFFQEHGFGLKSIAAWWHNSFYLEGQSLFFSKPLAISGFWNLNPYMNQRHLVFGAAFFLFFCFFWLKHIYAKKNISLISSLLIGLCFGLLAMWHTMVFLALLMLCVPFWLLYPSIRKPLFISAITACVFAFPQLLLIKLHSANTIVFKPGFLLENMLTIKNEAVFWFINLGIALFIIPVGFLMSNTEQKKFFILIAPLFLVPNLIHLSSRFTFDDHKYFNLWIIGANMFTALFITQVIRKNMFSKLFGSICIVLLTLSGCISIMVIKNDIYARIPRLYA